MINIKTLETFLREKNFVIAKQIKTGYDCRPSTFQVCCATDEKTNFVIKVGTEIEENEVKAVEKMSKLNLGPLFIDSFKCPPNMTVIVMQSLDKTIFDVFDDGGLDVENVKNLMNLFYNLVEKNISHGDLQSVNIMSVKEQNTNEIQWKLIDFEYTTFNKKHFEIIHEITRFLLDFLMQVEIAHYYGNKQKEILVDAAILFYDDLRAKELLCDNYYYTTVTSYLAKLKNARIDAGCNYDVLKDLSIKRT